jgi:DNA-binding GntR family transcriptional regulator
MQLWEETVEEVEANGPRGKKSTSAARRIREMIVTGELAPGSRIAERSITETLGISRTPLREAFKILQAEGLVRIEPNRGALVTQLSLSDVEAAIEMLIGLETVAAEHACQRASEAEIQAIAALHGEMVEAFEASDLMTYFHLNQTIHQKIVDCAHNTVLSRVYQGESARISRYRYAGNLQAERWRRAMQEHEQILDALKQREGRLLREILRAHHKRGWSATRSLLKGQLSS